MVSILWWYHISREKNFPYILKTDWEYNNIHPEPYKSIWMLIFFFFSYLKYWNTKIYKKVIMIYKRAAKDLFTFIWPYLSLSLSLSIYIYILKKTHIKFVNGYKLGQCMSHWIFIPFDRTETTNKVFVCLLSINKSQLQQVWVLWFIYKLSSHVHKRRFGRVVKACAC